MTFTLYKPVPLNTRWPTWEVWRNDFMLRLNNWHKWKTTSTYTYLCMLGETLHFFGHSSCWAMHWLIWKGSFWQNVCTFSSLIEVCRTILFWFLNCEVCVSNWLLGNVDDFRCIRSNWLCKVVRKVEVFMRFSIYWICRFLVSPMRGYSLAYLVCW